MSLKIILWFWLFWTWFFLFRGIFSCFNRKCIKFSFDPIAIHVIYILILIIHFIIIILILVFNQRLLCDLGILNRTPGNHNLWIQAAFERNLLYIYTLCLLKYFVEHLDSVYIVLENMIWINYFSKNISPITS